MMRKFVMTGAISVFFPDQVEQLWLGIIFSITFLALHLRLSPYSKPWCGIVQTACHLQLVFTYASAGTLLFDHGIESFGNQQIFGNRDAAIDIMLFIVNLSVFIIIIYACISSISKLRAHRLLLASGQGASAPRIGAGEFHLFLSHVWVNGQDQMRALKSGLKELIPGLEVFLY